MSMIYEITEEGLKISSDCSMFYALPSRSPREANWEGFCEDGPCYSREFWIRVAQGVWRYKFNYEVGMFDAASHGEILPEHQAVLEKAWVERLDNWAVRAFDHYPGFARELLPGETPWQCVVRCAAKTDPRWVGEYTG